MKSFVLSCLRHCAPTFRDNPKEITVSNFATTFDNADYSLYMASAPGDATLVNRIEILSNRIEFAFSRIAQL